MDWGFVGAIVGLFALVAAVVIGVVMYRRQFPKRRLDYWVESTPLVASAASAVSGLEVRVSGMKVLDPHLNTFVITSNSRADIASSAFDAQKPIRIEIVSGGAMHLPLSNEPHEIKFTSGQGRGLEWAEFQIGPQLIRKGMEGRLLFVSSGPPEMNFDLPLVDIESRHLTPAQVHSREPEVRQALIQSLWRLTGLLAVTLGAVLISWLVGLLLPGQGS